MSCYRQAQGKLRLTVKWRSNSSGSIPSFRPWSALAASALRFCVLYFPCRQVCHEERSCHIQTILTAFWRVLETCYVCTLESAARWEVQKTIVESITRKAKPTEPEVKRIQAQKISVIWSSIGKWRHVWWPFRPFRKRIVAYRDKYRLTYLCSVHAQPPSWYRLLHNSRIDLMDGLRPPAAR